MKRVRPLVLLLVPCLVGLDASAPSLREQNAVLFAQLRDVHGLDAKQLSDVESIFARSGFIGQGNPAIARHPETPEQCTAKLRQAGHRLRESRISSGSAAENTWRRSTIPRSETAEQARACIDQFEFPDIPCAYPVVWVRAREAAEICEAEGKRMCDAHEWEGACDGRLEPPDYRFDLARGVAPDVAVSRMRAAHNAADRPDSQVELRAATTSAASARPAATRRRAATAAAGSSAVRTRIPTGDFPGVPQSARRLRPQRQRRGAHEPAARRRSDVEPRQHAARLHGDEGQLVHLRHLPRARGLVPLARAVLARQPRHG